MVEEVAEPAAYYDIPIDDPTLKGSGFTLFKLPLNGNGKNINHKMILWNNEDKSKITYCDFYRSDPDIEKSVNSLKEKLIEEQHLADDKTTIENLITLFHNECRILKEDKDSKFFKGNGKGKAVKKSNNNNNDISSDDDEDSRTIAQKALDLAEANYSDLFVDQFGTPFAAIRINEHVETLPLKSSRFKNWLCRLFYESEEDVLSNENVNSVLNILKARAEFDGDGTKSLDLRIAKVPTKEELTNNTTIYYDLTNKDWQAVKITQNGWSVEYAPIIFRRYNNEQPQVYPSKEYPSDIFDKFMELTNIKGEDNKLLVKCYIIALFYPDIPKPVLMLHGEQGSAKTTVQELIRMLVDPRSIKTLTFPRDINELVQKLSHNYIAYFDNMSNIPEWISDQLCRAVTGSGFSKRELYTDDDDVIYNFKRCIGLVRHLAKGLVSLL